MTEALNEAFNIAIEKLENWGGSLIGMLPNIIMALLLLSVFYLSAKIIRKTILSTLGKISNNLAVNRLIASIVFLGIILAGLFVALGILNLDKTVTSLLAGLGIASLVIGFAFKDAAANFIAGIYMAIKSPINVEDIIEYDGSYGTVKEIGLRATTITTLQGQDIVIPNHLVIDNRFTHFTVNGVRRVDLDVGISYGDDLEKAEKVTVETIREIPFIRKNKPVDLFYTKFGDSSINFTVRYWVDFAKETDYLNALSMGIKKIKKAYELNGITITFPIRTLDFGIKGGKTYADMVAEISTKSMGNGNKKS